MPYPERRLRRLRRTPALRRLVAEHHVRIDDLVAPLFVKQGIDAPEPVVSMPGVVQHTQESLRKEVRALADLGVPAVMLFGIPEHKDARGSQADATDGVVQVALRTLRDEVGDATVLMADDCLDEYTDHGHCGLLTADGEIDNDATLERYATIAVAQAGAGADVIAPSGMMDGQVGAIRSALDGSGYSHVSILAYSPLTWYAATGTSNAPRTWAITSRYASAGLTITMSAPSSMSSATSLIASREFPASI